MKIEEYDHNLTDKDIIHVWMLKDKGKLLEVKIVYYFEDLKERHQIVRYDCSHGYLHKHLLFEPKQQTEAVYAELTGKLVNGLIQELKQNFMEYRHQYLKNHAWWLK